MLRAGSYELKFEDGGVSVWKEGKELYFNKRPIYISIKDISAVCAFKDIPYLSVREDGESIVASGTFVSDNGSEFYVEDRYEIFNNGLSESF